MTRKTGPRLAGDHTVFIPTIILLSNISTYVSAANGGHHLELYYFSGHQLVLYYAKRSFFQYSLF